MSDRDELTDLIAEHAVYGMSGGTHLACRCDRRWVPMADYRRHLVDELLTAGYRKPAT